jgi:hypothetical protein
MAIATISPTTEAPTTEEYVRYHYMRKLERNRDLTAHYDRVFSGFDGTNYLYKRSLKKLKEWASKHVSEVWVVGHRVYTNECEGSTHITAEECMRILFKDRL